MHSLTGRKAARSDRSPPPMSTRPWGERMKIDTSTIAIVKALRNGRESFKRIAERLGLAENTVRSRVQRLAQEKILDITGLVDPEALPGHQLVMIGVKLKTTDMFNKGQEFSRLKGVVSACAVTGRYDLILTVLFNESYNLEEFYTREVPRIADVQSLETFVICKGYNLKVPYVL
jgi:Lrp/AsnC family transcriptional regulator for asnA, asnC and gidA